MQHPEAVSTLQSTIETLEKLEGERCLRSSNCINNLLMIDQKVARLIRDALGRALDERDTYEIEF